jgi:glycosyltransferase
MKVSIITACLNSGQHIGQTIESVISQSYPNIEYILVDGKSTDGTLDIIRSYENRISSWISEPDKGIYHALNKGIRMATGDVIGFLHSDDFFADLRAVEKIVTLMAGRGSDSVYADIRYCDRNDSGKILTSRKSGPFSIRRFRFGWMPPHSAFYCKSHLFSNHGDFDTSFKIAADYDWLLRILVTQGVSTAYLPETLVTMRVGGISNRTMGGISHKWREDYRAMKRNGVFNPINLLLKSLRPIGHFYHSPSYLFR